MKRKGPDQSRRGPNPRELYVGNLPRSMPQAAKEERLKALFEPIAGPIEIIAVSTRGHAFVTIRSAVSVALILEQTWTIEGRQLIVQRRGEKSDLSKDEQAVLKYDEVATTEEIEVTAGKKSVKRIQEDASEVEQDQDEPLVKTDGVVIEKSEQSMPNKVEADVEQPHKMETGSSCKEEQHQRVQYPNQPEQLQDKPELLDVEDEKQAGVLRNIAIIAHVDAGKTTLSDSLLASAGQLSDRRAGQACVLDTGLEAERGITIYSSAVALHYPARAMQLNLVDCPGHAEFNSEVTAALRLVDGALLLVDAAEGVMPQTEAVLRQALADGITIALVINKLDKLFPDTRDLSGEGRMPISDDVLNKAHTQLRKIISRVNGIIDEHNSVGASLQANHVSLEEGSVCFGSARLGWMASLPSVAKLYGEKQERALRLLCNPEHDGKHVVRMVLRPIAELHALCGESDLAAVDSAVRKLGGVGLDQQVLDVPRVDAKAVRREAFKRLLPAAPLLLDLVTQHLPGPTPLQQARARRLCPSLCDTDDEWTQAIGLGSPTGPLMLYVAKSVLLPGSKTYAAVARIFSGTVKPGSEVFVLPPPSASSRVKASKGRVARVLQLEVGTTPKAIRSACAGDVCAIVGLEKALPREATISDDPLARPLAAMTFTVSAAERRALCAPKGQAERKLAEALPLLTRGDPLVRAALDAETGETVLEGAGDLHLDACVHRLRALMGAEGSKLVVQAAAVAHRETVLGTTPQPGMLGKSTNKHNRFWFVASPLTPELTTQFEEMGALGAEADEKDRAAALVEKHGWESKHARKILAVGPTGLGCNVLVDATVGIQGVDSVAEHLVAAFDATCRAGPVCSERLRGVRIDLIDAKIHAEGAQRRAPQCVPAAKRGMDAAILAATPTILEPVQNISLLAPLRLVDDAYDELRLRRSTNLSHDQAEHEAGMADAPCTLTGLIPLAEASGLAEILRGRLSGKATHLTLEFSHFGEVHGNIWDQETMAGAAVATIRQRKALLGSPLRAEAVADRL